MRRYEGTGLPLNPRVAVIANDAIGNFVVATPLLQAIRRELAPRVLHYFGGKRTWALQAASDLFDKSFPLHGREINETLGEVDGEYDLVINVEQGEMAQTFARTIVGDGYLCGPAGDLAYPADARGDLWRDREWISADICSKYPFLDSSWIGEFYVRLGYLDGPVPAYRVPNQPVEHDYDVLIAATASLPEKLWPLGNWVTVLSALEARGVRVGLLGAPPKEQGAHWKGADEESQMVATTHLDDCRGRWSLPEVVGAIDCAKAVLTLDNGIMHLAAATQTPAVSLFRHGIHRLWAPPVPTIHPIVAEEGSPVADIGTAEVLEALRRVV